MDEHKWRMTITISAYGFKELKSRAEQVLKLVKQAKSYRKLPIYESSYTMGGIHIGSSYSVEYQCPVEAEIKSLRERADELEASLEERQPEEAI